MGRKFLKLYLPGAIIRLGAPDLPGYPRKCGVAVLKRSGISDDPGDLLLQSAPPQSYIGLVAVERPGAPASNSAATARTA